MNAPAQLIELKPGEGPCYALGLDLYRILATGAQTGGAYTIVEGKVQPGSEIPPHIHRHQDEVFYVLEGDLEFWLNGRVVKAPAGSFVQGPRGIPHAFKNTGGAQARMLIYVSPPGFEDFVKDAGQPVASFDAAAAPLAALDVPKLLAVAAKHGIEILPPA